jgi:hypothetical protein
MAKFIALNAARTRSISETNNEALDDLAKMKAERDEARQKFCHTFMNPHIEAATRGWDCFKEDGK